MAAAVSLKLGVTPPHFVPPGVKVRAATYQALLQEYYFPRLLTCHQNEYFLFQEDNAPSHSAKTSRELLNALCSEAGGQRLCWPAASPDLNPLDYGVWKAWDDAVGRAGVNTSLGLLRSRILSANDELQKSDIVEKAIRSWPKRLKACVAAEGGAFEYSLA